MTATNLCGYWTKQSVLMSLKTLGPTQQSSTKEKTQVPIPNPMANLIPICSGRSIESVQTSGWNNIGIGSCRVGKEPSGRMREILGH